jgi:hypothetical protein
MPAPLYNFDPDEGDPEGLVSGPDYALHGGPENYYPVPMAPAWSGIAGALTDECVDEFGETMIPIISGNRQLLEYPFDIPCTPGLDYVDVFLSDLGAPAMADDFQIADDKFEYVGGGAIANVYIRPTIVNRATTGFRAVTSAVFDADAADYRYRGKVRGMLV